MQNLKKYKKQWFRNIKKMQNTEKQKTLVQKHQKMPNTQS